MYKLDFKKAEEPEIKLPTSVGSSKKQEFHKNIYFCFISYAKLLGSQETWKILYVMEISEHLACFLKNLHAGQEATTVRTGHGTAD